MLRSSASLYDLQLGLGAGEVLGVGANVTQLLGGAGVHHAALQGLVQGHAARGVGLDQAAGQVLHLQEPLARLIVQPALLQGLRG